MRKIKRKTPSGRIVQTRRRERGGYSRCARCGNQLHGVPLLSSFQLSKIPKTAKRPTRAYGGFYCGNCARELFKEKARSI